MCWSQFVQQIQTFHCTTQTLGASSTNLRILNWAHIVSGNISLVQYILCRLLETELRYLVYHHDSFYSVKPKIGLLKYELDSFVYLRTYLIEYSKV